MSAKAPVARLIEEGVHEIEALEGYAFGLLRQVQNAKRTGAKHFAVVAAGSSDEHVAHAAEVARAASQPAVAAGTVAAPTLEPEQENAPATPSAEGEGEAATGDGTAPADAQPEAPSAEPQVEPAPPAPNP